MTLVERPRDEPRQEHGAERGGARPEQPRDEEVVAHDDADDGHAEANDDDTEEEGREASDGRHLVGSEVHQ